MYYTTLALLTISLVAHVVLISANEPETVADYYEKGIEAYLEEKYPQCVEKLEAALKRYRYLTKSTQHCRLKCKHDYDNEAPFYPENIDDLHFFGKNLKITLCILRCKTKISDNSEYLGGDLEKMFEERKPYEYLNLCYYKINDKQKAASAAFTFLVAHPNHPVMTKNLEHYSKMHEIDMKDIINFEAEDYVYLYAYGADAYEKKDWNSVINHMEESVVSYLQAEDECRANCEGPFNPGWHPDFIPAIANHFSFVLKCKRKCVNLLNTLNGEKLEDLLASHYHYLQYAYFKTGNMPAACQAVASYLLLVPNDIIMLENMKYYAKLPKVEDEYFQPREEAIRYTQRNTYEQKILEFIKDEFKLDKPEVKNKNLKRDFHILQNASELGGTKRFSSDGLATIEDCKSLMYIANNFSSLNDGYTNGNITNMSPHTKHELFQGITLSRVTFLTYIGMLNPEYLSLLLNVSYEIKRRVSEVFKIERYLHFSYTHLVCRSAIKGTEQRKDLSHKVHADNCVLRSDTVCDKEDPAFYWRDYSAILYLNEDFEGGEFMFSQDAMGKAIQSTISPKCGRMIAFSSGLENLHGVKAVTKGKRCALAVWFTFDPKYREFDRDLAQNMLDHNITFDQFSNKNIRELT